MKRLMLMGLALGLLAGPAFEAMAATPIQLTVPGGQYVTAKGNKNGALIAPGNDSNDFTAQFALADNTVTNIKAAPGAAVRACMRWATLQGVTATTVVTATFKRGSTTLFVFNIPAGVSFTEVRPPSPVCGNANEALTVNLSGTPTGSVQLNAEGYTVPN